MRELSQTDVMPQQTQYAQPSPAGMSPFAALLQQADPGQIQAMVASGLVDDRMGLQAAAMKRAMDLSKTTTPDGRVVGKQQVYVASSPLEHLAAAMRQGMGFQGMNAAQGQQENLIGQKGAGVNALLRLAAMGG